MNRKVLLAGLILIVPLVGVLLANMGRNPNQIDSPLIGKTAPSFSLRPVGGGERVSLAALRGTPVVLNFWATWCIPCFQEHPVLAAAARRYGNRVQFLGVVYDDKEATIGAFLQRYGSNYPNLMDDDGQVAIAYGVYGVPETYFVDGEGKIVYKHVGPLTHESLAARLRQAGAENP